MLLYEIRCVISLFQTLSYEELVQAELLNYFLHVIKQLDVLMT